MKIIKVIKCDKMTVKQADQKVKKVTQLINELVAIGDDPSIFHGATFKNKTFKSIKKLLDKVN